jgi:hypothetical protein
MIEVLKNSLEVLEINLIFLKKVKPFKGQEDLATGCISMTKEMIASLRLAIADLEKQEPVAWTLNGNIITHKPTDAWTNPSIWTPLYASPQPRKPITKEQIISILDYHFECVDSEYIKRAAKEIVAYGIKE